MFYCIKNLEVNEVNVTELACSLLNFKVADFRTMCIVTTLLIKTMVTIFCVVEGWNSCCCDYTVIVSPNLCRLRFIFSSNWNLELDLEFRIGTLLLTTKFGKCFTVHKRLSDFLL